MHGGGLLSASCELLEPRHGSGLDITMILDLYLRCDGNLNQVLADADAIRVVRADVRGRDGRGGGDGGARYDEAGRPLWGSAPHSLVKVDRIRRQLSWETRQPGDRTK